LYFGTTNGLFVIHPNRIRETEPPPVVLMDLKLFNKSVPIAPQGTALTEHLSACEEVKLGHGQRLVTIDFAALDYMDPSQNQYAYKLEGLMDEWIHQGNKASVTFTNLDPGDYVFHVKAANSEGVWNEAGASLRLIITPFWWETMWFKILIILLFIAGVIGILEGRVQLVKAQRRSLVVKVNERTNELRIARDKLSEAKDNLEVKVEKRTSELNKEIAEREKIEQKYRTVANFTYDWEYWEDPDGKLLYVSPSCERVTGYTQDEFLYNPEFLNDIITTEDKHLFEDHRHDADEKKSLREIQFRIRRKDGDIRWIEHACCPVEDKHGISLGFRVSNRDITIRKKAEELLQQNENKLNEALKIGRMGYWEYNIETGRTDFSDEIYSFYERTRDQGIPLINSEDALKYYSPEDIKKLSENTEKVISTGESFEFDYKVNLPSGSINYLSSTIHPLKDDNGQVIGCFGITQDITKRKQVEEKLIDSEKNLLKAQHLAGMGFLKWNIKTNEMQWSDEVYRLYGIEKGKQEITLDFTVSMVHPEDLEDVQKCLELAIKGVIKYDINHRIIRPDGKVIWVNAMAELNRDKNGNPESLLGTVINITRHKEAEETIQKSQDSLRFLAGKLLTAQEEERRLLAREMHDDLTQRLALLAIEAGKLESTSPQDDSNRRAELQEMKKKIIKLSKDIHDISRQIHPAILDDLGLVDALKSECKAFSQREEIDVAYNTKNVPAFIPKNIAICIYRITQESLRNIAKYAKTNEASVSLVGNEDNLILTVTDNGVGFDITKIRNQQGIGLSSMKERARLIQGEFSVQSTQSKGTIIKVKVPYKKGEQA